MAQYPQVRWFLCFIVGAFAAVMAFGGVPFTAGTAGALFFVLALAVAAG